jgi:hypothetical protein
MKNNIQYCQYCSNKLKFTPNSYYKCSFHKNEVIFYTEGFLYYTKVFCITLYSSNIRYLVQIYPTDYLLDVNDRYNCMFFYHDGYFHKLPIDPNLTPENIDRKIKTYLTFQ